MIRCLQSPTSFECSTGTWMFRTAYQIVNIVSVRHVLSYTWVYNSIVNTPSYIIICFINFSFNDKLIEILVWGKILDQQTSCYIQVEENCIDNICLIATGFFYLLVALNLVVTWRVCGKSITWIIKHFQSVNCIDKICFKATRFIYLLVCLCKSTLKSSNIFKVLYRCTSHIIRKLGVHDKKVRLVNITCTGSSSFDFKVDRSFPSSPSSSSYQRKWIQSLEKRKNYQTG